MMLKEIDLQNYLFKTDVYELPPTTRLEYYGQPAAGDDRNFQRKECVLKEMLFERKENGLTEIR